LNLQLIPTAGMQAVQDPPVQIRSFPAGHGHRAYGKSLIIMYDCQDSRQYNGLFLLTRDATHLCRAMQRSLSDQTIAFICLVSHGRQESGRCMCSP